MLPSRAADVPTGAQYAPNATVRKPMRLRGEHVSTQAFLPSFHSSPDPLGSAHDPPLTFACHRGRPRHQLPSLASRRLPGARSRQHPQGTQTEDSFGNSFAVNHVTNVIATTQQVSCYTPEVPFTVSDGPVDWYTGETPCNGAATTGEDLGPYATQQGSNGGFPGTATVLVNNQ